MFTSFALAFLSQQAAANCSWGCDCVAIKNNRHWATDSWCSQCASGYQWWPCNLDGACECKSNASTRAPVATNRPVNPNRPCDSCGSCEAQPNNPHNASDAHCAPCANGDQPWWPCNRSDLCQCSGNNPVTTTVRPRTTTQSTTTRATTTTATTTRATTTIATTTRATTTEAPVTTGSPVTTRTSAPNGNPCSSCGSCEAQPNNPHNASDAHCAPCANDGQSWWPCNRSDLCQCSGNSPSTPAPVTTSAPVTTKRDDNDNSVIDTTLRKAQATVFGDYFNIAWNQVICSMDESDAKPYMQAQHPHCAAAINMGSGAFQTTDQNGKPGFCTRTRPGNGAPSASSCWKVRCVGGDNQLGVGVSCAHHNWIYLKTVDTNTENNLSLTDNEYTRQCAQVAEQTNTPSCRAFDITVQAWDLMVVFSQNQGANAGKPAGLNGIVPVEYEEVDCNDSVVKAAISSSQCGLQNTFLV